MKCTLHVWRGGIVTSNLSPKKIKSVKPFWTYKWSKIDVFHKNWSNVSFFSVRKLSVEISRELIEISKHDLKWILDSQGDIESQYNNQRVSHPLRALYLNFKIFNGTIPFVIPQIKGLNKYFLSAHKKIKSIDLFSNNNGLIEKVFIS